jgi:hypothetical protein
MRGVWRAACLPAIVIGVLSFLVYLHLTPASPSDFSAHRWLAHLLVKAGDFPPYPLFHLCLIALSGGQPLNARVESAILLALATGACAGLSAAYFASRAGGVLAGVADSGAASSAAGQRSQQSDAIVPAPDVQASSGQLATAPGNRARLSAFQLTLLCLVLALAMPLPNWWRFPAVYLGQVSPNVWHNPTAIFCLPFALGAFWLGVRAMERFSVGVAAGLGAVLALSLLAMPNYFLAFAPCLAVALNRAVEKQTADGRITLAGQIVRFGLAFLPPALVLALQALALDVQRGSVVFSPLTDWSTMSPNIPASIFLGIAFPFCVAIGYRRRLAGEHALFLAWATLAVAILTFVLAAERTTLPPSGIFGWGMITANRVLFVATTEFLLRQPRSKWWWLNWGVLGLHTIVGAAYLTRALVDPSRIIDF